MPSHSVASALKAFAHDESYEKDGSYDVIIQFHSAKNLPRTDLFGYTDPYFIAKIDGQIAYTSNIIRNTSTPKWENEEWIVRNIPRQAKLTVQLFDKDDEKLSDDYIGRFVIKNFIDSIPPSKGYKIIGALGHYTGRFYLSILSQISTEESRQLPRYTFDGICRYFCHNSLVVGRLTMLNKNLIFSTWKIEMKRISVFFPEYERQHWNKQYKAAQKIFNGYPLSIASQNTIKLAHKVLYERTLKHNQNGRLESAIDLWKHILTDELTNQIRLCVYTYVIDDYTWRFSQTGRQFFTDFASKHALLANCSTYVRYAGEFHPRPKYGWDRMDDEWELVFDNGSGTYSPTADLLENLKQLLLFNFPGLNVVIYDYKDPRLKQSMEELKIIMEKYKHITPTIDKLVSCFPSLSEPIDTVL